MKKILNKSNNHKAASKALFPKSLLDPVGDFLKNRLTDLEKKRKNIKSEDPFQDTNRLIDNASPDTDAYEQFGHARSSAIRRAIDKNIIQTKKALSKVKIGSYGVCEDCAGMIDTDRLMIYPEAILCAKCQKKREK